MTGTLRFVATLYREHLRHHKRDYLLALLCMMAVGIFAGLQAQLVEPVINDAILAQRMDLIFKLAALVALISLAKGLAIYGQGVLLTRAGLTVVAKLQTHMIQRLLAATLAFHDENPSAALAARTVHDTYALRQTLSNTVLVFSRDGFMVLVLAGVMVWQSPVLALAVLVVASPAVLGTTTIGRKLRTNARRYHENVADLSRRLVDTLHGIIPIRMAHAAAEEWDNKTQTLTHMARLMERGAELRARTYPLFGLIHGVAFALIFIIGIQQIQAGALDLGRLFSFTTALLMAFKPMQGFAQAYASLQEGVVAFERIQRILKAPIPAPTPQAQTSDLPTRVEVQNLSYAYNPSAPDSHVLRNISCTLNAPGLYGLEGPSGSGKSTLLLALAGLLPYDGTIVVDGAVRQGLGWVAYVAQFPRLLDGSLLENITLGAPGPDRARALEAAHQAGMADWVPNQEALLRPSGELGWQLSGGQRSRVAIARALYQQRMVWLMDEPASSLDAAGTESLMALLEEHARHRLIIVASHRPLAQARAVLTLERGALL